MKRRVSALGMLIGLLFVGLVSSQGSRIEELKRRLGFIQGPSPTNTVQKGPIKSVNKQNYRTKSNVKRSLDSPVFNVDALVKSLRAIESRTPESYIPFYLTVPREIVLKNKLASFLANGLGERGEKHVIDEQSQKPLLNYLAYIVSGEPIQAEFRPRKLVDKKSRKPRLLRQKVFGPRKELNVKDFSTVAAYKAEALDDLLKFANSRMRDNAGGQMLIQLFIPKDKVDAIAQARMKGEQYAIDQLMQPGPDLNKRLVDANAQLYLQPDADYTFVKLIMHDLSPKEDRAKLDKQMRALSVKVVDQVVDTLKHLPEPLSRDHEPSRANSMSKDALVKVQQGAGAPPARPPRKAKPSGISTVSKDAPVKVQQGAGVPPARPPRKAKPSGISTVSSDASVKVQQGAGVPPARPPRKAKPSEMSTVSSDAPVKVQQGAGVPPARPPRKAKPSGVSTGSSDAPVADAKNLASQLVKSGLRLPNVQRVSKGTPMNIEEKDEVISREKPVVASHQRAPIAQPMEIERPATPIEKSSVVFDQNKVMQTLRSREKQAAPHGYVPLYFAVPREVVLKKMIMSFLDTTLRDLGHDNIIKKMYQYPLLNYIAYRANSKPISVQSTPEKLISKNMLSRQSEFGSFNKFGLDDFVEIKGYNPASLNEFIAFANNRIDDNAGGQMLAQLFVPKNDLNKVVYHEKISLNPSINYPTFKLFTSDLQSAQKTNVQNKKMGELIKQVAKQVDDTIKKPVVKTQPAQKTPVRKKAPGGLLGEIQAGKELHKAETKKHAPASEPKSLIELELAKKFGKVHELAEEASKQDSWDDDAMDIDIPVQVKKPVTRPRVSPISTLQAPSTKKTTPTTIKAEASPSRGSLLAQIQAGKQLKQAGSKEVQAQQQSTSGRGSALALLAEKIAAVPQDAGNAMDIDSDEDDGWDDDDDDGWY